MARDFETCEDGELWDISQGKCVIRSDRELVGDNKLPNKYFVTFVNAEYICKEEDGAMHCDWDENIESRGGTFAVADTYREALELLQSIYNDETWIFPKGRDSFLVTSKMIEDRLSGVIAQENIHNYTRTIKERESEFYDDTGYTREEMQKRGAVFE